MSTVQILSLKDKKMLLFHQICDWCYTLSFSDFRIPDKIAGQCIWFGLEIQISLEKITL